MRSLRAALAPLAAQYMKLGHESVVREVVLTSAGERQTFGVYHASSKTQVTGHGPLNDYFEMRAYARRHPIHAPEDSAGEEFEGVLQLKPVDPRLPDRPGVRQEVKGPKRYKMFSEV